MQKASAENYVNGAAGLRSLFKEFDFQILSGNRTSCSSNITQAIFMVVTIYLNFMRQHCITHYFQLHNTLQSLAIYFFDIQKVFIKQTDFFFFSFSLHLHHFLFNNTVPSAWTQNFPIILSKLASQILVVSHTSKKTADEMPALKNWIESVYLLAKMTFFSRSIFNLLLEGQIIYYVFKMILSYLRKYARVGFFEGFFHMVTHISTITVQCFT